jgi:hypothetical protein
MEKKKGKIKTAKATEEEDDDDSESRLMMHKAAKQLAGPQRAGVLSFCVCAPCSWEERKLKRRRRDHWVVFFLVSLSSTNERIHYEEENHNHLHTGAQATLDPTKQF